MHFACFKVYSSKVFLKELFLSWSNFFKIPEVSVLFRSSELQLLYSRFYG